MEIRSTFISLRVWAAFAAVACALFLALPLVARAHETRIYEVGGNLYRFVVGSIGEPIKVDDKTGVDLRVGRIPSHVMPDGSVMSNAHHGGSADEIPVEGLETTLRVELRTNGAAKVLPLETVYGSAGAYKASYYPTKPMEITYRIFGEIDGVPIDVSFICSATGHNMEASEEDTARVEEGEGVVRISKRGAFSCPEARDDISFPEAVPSALESVDGGSNAVAGAGLALGALALALALRRGRVRDV